jgi:predicted amidophosphoribosyltransferase
MLLAALLPVRCPGCGVTGASPCHACASRLRSAPAGPVHEALDACWSLFAYEDLGRLLVTNLKYRRDRAALGWLATGMAGLLTPPAGVIVTWAPTTGARRRRRGFDQAELLARAVARLWGATCRALLARKAGPPQTGRSIADRRQGPILLARAGSRVAAGSPVMVVDDVLTTGSTLAAAGRALRSIDVPWTAGLTAARTPRHGESPPCVLAVPPQVEHFPQAFGATGR